MNNLLTKCVSDLKQHALAIGIGAIVGFALGLTANSLGAFISFGPLLALLCLVPCLAPLLLLRRADKKPQNVSAAESVELKPAD